MGQCSGWAQGFSVSQCHGAMLPELFAAFTAFTSIKIHSTGQATATDWSKKLAKSVGFLAEKSTELELFCSHWPLREAINSRRMDKKQSEEF